MDVELRALIARDAIQGAVDIAAAQVQPASLDLRLGPKAHRVRAGFLPGVMPMEERLASLSTSALDLGAADGAVLERGLVYLVQLEESLQLPPDM